MALPDINTLQQWAREAVPAAAVEIVPNEAPCGPASLRVDRLHALAVAAFLRDDPRLSLDFASNVTGIDWLPLTVREKAIERKVVAGEEKDGETAVERVLPGRLEVVYHLYSMRLGHGPVVLRLATGNRSDDVEVPSLTSIWRSAEFQEREVFDLFGIRFVGHPDLRRILMWDGYEDHPMRKDYVDPDDYEYEPTPHDAVLERVRARTGAGEGGA
jgi:NADH-quinone oxidoreductase subunit C